MLACPDAWSPASIDFYRRREKLFRPIFQLHLRNNDIRQETKSRMADAILRPLARALFFFGFTRCDGGGGAVIEAVRRYNWAKAEDGD